MSLDECNNLEVSVASLAYCLYRLAGCPYGDTVSGLTVWIDIQKETFAVLADAVEQGERGEQDKAN
jgi:hypothetical protein